MAEIALLEQGKGFFKQLPAWQKIVIGAVLAALVVGMVFILSSSKKTEYGVLYSGLEAQDASKIVESLKTKGTEYKLEENGGTILVDKEKLYDTRISLAGEGLPEQSTVGYELFDKTNLGMSEFVQKLNYKRSLEGELARTISSLDEVKKVRVHIVLPEKTLFKKDEKVPTASVTLHLKSGRSISKISVEGIQNLVSSSVEGMTIEKVIVVDSRGKVLSESALDENTVAGLTASQHDQQRKVEQYLAQQIQTMLDGVLGSDNSKVRVNADIDFTQIEKTVTDFDPERQVVRSEQNILEKSSNSDSLSYPAVNQSKDQSNVIQNYEISKSVSHIVEGVGGVKRLSVSTLVNGTVKVVDKEGKKILQYIPRSKEEMEQLTIAVKNAVGYDPSRNDQISVLNVPFDTSLEEQELETLQPVEWWKDKENQKLILLVFAMLVTIFIMYRLLVSKQVKDRLRIAMSLPVTVGLPDVEDEEDEEEAEEELEEFSFDEDDLLLLPADLPEQLLLEGEKIDMEDEQFEDQSGDGDEDLSARVKAALGDTQMPEMTEETLMKLEIKDKVESFMDDQTEDAIKLIRIFISQDLSGGF